MANSSFDTILKGISEKYFDTFSPVKTNEYRSLISSIDIDVCCFVHIVSHDGNTIKAESDSDDVDISQTKEVLHISNTVPPITDQYGNTVSGGGVQLNGDLSISNWSLEAIFTHPMRMTANRYSQSMQISNIGDPSGPDVKQLVPRVKIYLPKDATINFKGNIKGGGVVVCEAPLLQSNVTILHDGAFLSQKINFATLEINGNGAAMLNVAYAVHCPRNSHGLWASQNNEEHIFHGKGSTVSLLNNNAEQTLLRVSILRNKDVNPFAEFIPLSAEPSQ
ncbi:MAG: hypothetical protein ABW189_06940 [Rickettsiales bacterium]